MLELCLVRKHTLERESIMRGARANPSLGLFGKWNGISASHTPKGSQESIYFWVQSYEYRSIQEFEWKRDFLRALISTDEWKFQIAGIVVRVFD